LLHVLGERVGDARQHLGHGVGTVAQGLERIDDVVELALDHEDL
jgi:hypothetical protein